MTDFQGKRDDQVAFSTVVAFTCFAVGAVCFVGAYIATCAGMAR